MKNNYFLQRDMQNIQKLSKYISSLPSYCFEYFLEMENYSSTLTRLGYATDLTLFFEFLSKYKFEKDVKDIALNEIEKITVSDITSFLSYISYYNHNGKNLKNTEKGKSRKLASIKSFFKYLFKHDLIKSNITTKIEAPKIHQKEIIRLDIDEIVNILNQAEVPNNLTKNQQNYNKHTKERDIAILSLFLSTGIRVSELVGLNVEDFDFKNNAFLITRKGGNQATLYFSEEVAQTLQDWIKIRALKPLPESENAMFISLQNKRISVRAVEILVKKYAKAINPLKNITPHKLRSTFGTNLYRETRDIYIVADVLGHKDINITKKHYAAMSDDIRKNVADIVKLRK